MNSRQPASALQRSAQQFFETRGWNFEQTAPEVLTATKRVAGMELRWAVCFEDETSFSQLTNPGEFVHRLLTKGAHADFLDLICTEGVFQTRRWSEEVRPIIQSRFAALRNREFGSWAAFLNRFAREISIAQNAAVDEILEKHSIRQTVRATFTNHKDALKDCINWLDDRSTRIMLVTGGPGAGKSVFALSLAKEIHAQFLRDPLKYPAPFLVWFSTSRPPVLEDLIGITLAELHTTDLTADAVKFLLRQGRIVLILDGFDEISRALAHRAEETIDKLSREINKNTNGRLILTSRPAFLHNEKVYVELTTACEDDRPETREIAEYSDDQQRAWVMANAPDHPDAKPPARHWGRITAAFGANPWLRDLCRIPVFLRMLSEVLLKDRSVRSRDDLITMFCTGMWERERGRRMLALTDAQYLSAYEAISAAIVELGQIDASEAKDWLEAYLEQDSKQLLAELPDPDAAIRDLAIGPLTGHGGQFAFEHEILTGYFFARLLARCLRANDRRTRELWNKEIFEPAWAFLPQAVRDKLGTKGDEFLRQMSSASTDGLMLWNIARAVGCTLPKDLFKAKDIAGIVFESDKPGTTLNLSSMAFDDSNLHKVDFVRCDLSGTTFRGCKIGKMRFIDCMLGAIFDADPQITNEDAEITIGSTSPKGEEVYTKKKIAQALKILSGSTKEDAPKPMPADMAEQAVIVIFTSLYKSDLMRLDYPEMRKIENSLRAWLREFNLSTERFDRYISLLMELYSDLEGSGWICLNPARARTRVPCEERVQSVGQIVRSGRIPVHLNNLRQLVDRFNQQLRSVGSL